jgi:hypothetical protein
MILGGIGLLLVVTAAIGNRDKSGETVPADAWAQSVCGVIGTWRGEMEDIVDEIRQAPATGTGVEEPQSQTPQGTTGLVRTGLERSIRATDTLVTGIDDAGTPDTPKGTEGAQLISQWATTSRTALQQAQDSLDHEAPTLEEAVAQYASAAQAIQSVLATGVHTLSQLAALDPELAAAVQASSTCQQLREEQSST